MRNKADYLPTGKPDIDDTNKGTSLTDKTPDYDQSDYPMANIQQTGNGLSRTIQRARSAEAFEYYYNLGPNRTYAEVASKYNVTITTVQNWVKNYKWSEKLVERVKAQGEPNVHTITNKRLKELEQKEQDLQDLQNLQKKIDEDQEAYLNQRFEEAKETIAKKELDALTRYRILITDLIDQTREAIQTGELQIRNITDLDRVIRLDILLMQTQNADDITDQNYNNTTDSARLTKEDTDRLDKIAKILSGKATFPKGKPGRKPKAKSDD